MIPPSSINLHPPTHTHTPPSPHIQSFIAHIPQQNSPINHTRQVSPTALRPARLVRHTHSLAGWSLARLSKSHVRRPSTLAAPQLAAQLSTSFTHNLVVDTHSMATAATGTGSSTWKGGDEPDEGPATVYNKPGACSKSPCGPASQHRRAAKTARSHHNPDDLRAQAAVHPFVLRHAHTGDCTPTTPALPVSTSFTTELSRC